jgi:hypothetical protein
MAGDVDPAEALAAAVRRLYNPDPADRMAAAFSAAFAVAPRNGAPDWRFRGEGLPGGRTRLSVTNGATGETWPIEMSRADRLALARELSRD